MFTSAAGRHGDPPTSREDTKIRPLNHSDPDRQVLRTLNRWLDGDCQQVRLPTAPPVANIDSSSRYNQTQPRTLDANDPLRYLIVSNLIEEERQKCKYKRYIKELCFIQWILFVLHVEAVNNTCAA